MTDRSQTFRIVAINMESGARWIVERGRSERDAEAIASAAVATNGMSAEFYTMEPEYE